MRRSEPRQPDVQGEVEPDDDVGLPRARGRRSCRGSRRRSPSRQPPSTGSSRRAELVVGRLDPVRAVHERVELDERDPEPAGELPADRRLAAAARRRGDGDLPHRRRRVAIGSSPSPRRGSRAAAGLGPRRPRRARCPGRRLPRRRRRRSRPGTRLRPAACRRAVGAPRRRSAGSSSRRGTRARRSSPSSSTENESVTQASNQQFAPAETPPRAAPPSQACRSASSIPCRRQSASRFAVFPPEPRRRRPPRPAPRGGRGSRTTSRTPARNLVARTPRGMRRPHDRSRRPPSAGRRPAAAAAARRRGEVVERRGSVAGRETRRRPSPRRAPAHADDSRMLAGGGSPGSNGSSRSSPSRIGRLVRGSPRALRLRLRRGALQAAASCSAARASAWPR